MAEAGDLELDRDEDDDGEPRVVGLPRRDGARWSASWPSACTRCWRTRRRRSCTPPDAPPDDVLPDGGELAPEQWAGVRGAFAHRFSLVTGGPGTGKTASIRMIGAIAAQQRASLLLVAPTGRAALRMREATGLEASTVHSALGWIPGEGPTHDEDDPLRCDLLVVDETSMANLELLVTLLRAVGPGTHVVLVGDADQLAPVGAGKPFAELVASELVPTARLRTSSARRPASMIVQGAHAIRVGRAAVVRARSEGMRQDLFLIERADPVAAREEIVGLVSRRLPEHYGVDPVNDVQVFAPVYRGELGIDALNDALRTALNPGGEPLGNGRLRIGDKLMLVGRNLHELGLMNGTLLRLLDALDDATATTTADGGVLVATDAGAIVEIPPAEVGNLRLAYACSVHRGQGIELPIAIVVAHPAAGGRFLRREMLYTAITRAKTATVVVGTGAMVARAAATADVGRRHSRLAARLARGRRLSARPVRPLAFGAAWTPCKPSSWGSSRVSPSSCRSRPPDTCGSSPRCSAGTTRAPRSPPSCSSGRWRPCCCTSAPTCGGSARAWLSGLRNQEARRTLDARLGWYIVVGTIPIAVIGLLFADPIETEFRNLYLIGTTLIVFGLLMLLADRYAKRERGVESLTARDGVVDRLRAGARARARRLALGRDDLRRAGARARPPGGGALLVPAVGAGGGAVGAVRAAPHRRGGERVVRA